MKHSNQSQNRTSEEHPLSSRLGQWTSGVDPLAVGAVWLLFLLALPFLEGGGLGIEAVIGGGLIGLALVVLGYLAASRYRSIPERGGSERARIAAFALLLGIGVGALNLGVNVGLATADASIRALLQEHFAEPMSWARVASVAVVEEVVSRLFLMSVVAWITARFVSRPRVIFLTALVVSALLFGLPHLLGRPMPTEAALAALYGLGVVVKSTAAGLLLGWVFWRWGLPYAILIHFLGNGLHKVFEPLFFS